MRSMETLLKSINREDYSPKGISEEREVATALLNKRASHIRITTESVRKQHVFSQLTCSDD